MSNDEMGSPVKRRDFLRSLLHSLSGITLGGIAGFLIGRSSNKEMVWQLDPNICVQCEKCSLNCVLPVVVAAAMVSVQLAAWDQKISG